MEEAARTRAQRWSSIFGIDKKTAPKARFWNVSHESKSSVSEQRVIKQDVLRTRADELYFSDTRMRQLLEHCLLCFCSYYSFEYMQGLNEILAPLLAMNVVAVPGHYALINDPSNSSMKSESIDSNKEDSNSLCGCSNEDIGEIDLAAQNSLEELIVQHNLPFIFFERIVTSLNPVIFTEHGISALQGQLASFHNLLFYVDAELAMYLFKEGMRSDVYAQAWFITLFLRRAPVEVALYILDKLIPYQNCPCFLIIFAVSFLIQQRRTLLFDVDKDELPTLLVRMAFSEEKEVDKAAIYAEALLKTIPPSIVKAMNAIGFDPTVPPSAREAELKTFFRRPSVVLSVADIVKSPEGVPFIGDSGNEGLGSPLLRVDTFSEDEDEDEDKDSSIRLLPLNEAVREQEPASLSKTAKQVGYSLHASMTSIAHEAVIGLGTFAQSLTKDYGNVEKDKTISSTSQSDVPRHTGYLLFDCRDPLALAKRENKESMCPPYHPLARVDIEAAVQVPPEVIAEMCELAQRYSKNIHGINRADFDVEGHTEWPLVVKLYALLSDCALKGIHIVLFDDSITSSCLDRTQATDTNKVERNLGSSSPKEAFSSRKDPFTNLHSQFRSSLAKIVGSVATEKNRSTHYTISPSSPFAPGIPSIPSPAKGSVESEKESTEMGNNNTPGGFQRKGNAVVLATALLVLGFPNVALMHDNTSGLFKWTRSPIDYSKDGDGDTRGDGPDCDDLLRKRAFPKALIESIAKDNSSEDGYQHPAHDGVSALLYEFIRDDHRKAKKAGLDFSFTNRIIDRRTDTCDFDDPYNSIISIDHRGIPMSMSSMDSASVATSASPDDTHTHASSRSTKPDPLRTPSTSEMDRMRESGPLEADTERQLYWKVKRLCQRYLLCTPELVPVQMQVKASLDPYLKAIGEAVTMESLKLSGEAKKRLQQMKKDAHARAANKGRVVPETGLGSIGSPSFLGWGLGEGLLGGKTGDSLGELAQATTSALGAMASKVSWSTSKQESSFGVQSDAAATPVRSLFQDYSGEVTQSPSTPEKSMLTPNKDFLTPGIEVLHKAGSTHRVSTTDQTSEPAIRHLKINTNAEDAARLQHYMVMNSASKREMGNITRYIEDLRQLQADLTQIQKSARRISHNYEQLLESSSKKL